MARRSGRATPRAAPAAAAPRRGPLGHVRHHGRFYGALAVGIAVAIAAYPAGGALRLLLAGDAFFLAYLVSTAVRALRMSPDDLRHRARYEDDGILLIVLATIAAIGLSLAAIFAVIADSDGRAASHVAAAILAVPAGWLTLHTLAAFHYANLYYADVDPSQDTRDAGGLGFPGTEQPAPWDFLYHAFVVGMTAQVADVQVLNTAMRRFVLLHAVTSFFYNTVLLALAVNIAVQTL